MVLTYFAEFNANPPRRMPLISDPRHVGNVHAADDESSWRHWSPRLRSNGRMRHYRPYWLGPSSIGTRRIPTATRSFNQTTGDRRRAATPHALSARRGRSDTGASLADDINYLTLDACRGRLAWPNQRHGRRAVSALPCFPGGAARARKGGTERPEQRRSLETIRRQDRNLDCEPADPTGGGPHRRTDGDTDAANARSRPGA